MPQRMCRKNEWTDENGDSGPGYGYRWRFWPAADGGHIDPISHVTGAASLPEVCGVATVYVSPKSEESIAAGLRDFWLSPSHRDDLRQRRARSARGGSTGSSSSTAPWRVYEQVLGARA